VLQVDVARRGKAKLVSVEEWVLIDRFAATGREFLVVRRPRIDVMPLSSREHEVLAAAKRGWTNKEIAYRLGVAQSTVRVIMARIARKLGVRGRAAVVARARRDSLGM
jgi:DNA-binding NarL/FixJ family response regulator